MRLIVRRRLVRLGKTLQTVFAHRLGFLKGGSLTCQNVLPSSRLLSTFIAASRLTIKRIIPASTSKKRAPVNTVGQTALLSAKFGRKAGKRNEKNGSYA